MLLPRKTKFRKHHRGRRDGLSKGQTSVHYGDFGLKALESAWVTNRQIEAARVAETRQELFNLRFQAATGALENSARLRLAKRDIARILTIRREREATLERT